MSWTLQEVEVREMRRAETILDVIRERGRKGLPLERVYRLLYNPELYLKAYGKIYPNDGALTPGPNEETADRMSLAKIGAIIDALRHERYRWRPTRRVYIEKSNSNKLRPLGLPAWSDKLLQEVIRSILEAYYEPQFSSRSHGFRPGRGCHSALTEVQRTWKGTAWFIEGDICDCFGSLDHSILMSILSEKIHDDRFLRLIENLLKAGYLEEWRFNKTLSGAPQGGVLTPPTMLQIAPLGAWIKRVLIYPEHHVHLSFSYLHALHQGADDAASSAPIGFFQAIFHLLAKLFYSTDDQPEFCLQHRFVGQLLGLFFEFADAPS